MSEREERVVDDGVSVDDEDADTNFDPKHPESDKGDDDDLINTSGSESEATRPKKQFLYCSTCKKQQPKDNFSTNQQHRGDSTRRCLIHSYGGSFRTKPPAKVNMQVEGSGDLCLADDDEEDEYSSDSNDDAAVIDDAYDAKKYGDLVGFVIADGQIELEDKEDPLDKIDELDVQEATSTSSSDSESNSSGDESMLFSLDEGDAPRVSTRKRRRSPSQLHSGAATKRKRTNTPRTTSPDAKYRTPQSRSKAPAATPAALNKSFNILVNKRVKEGVRSHIKHFADTTAERRPSSGLRQVVEVMDLRYTVFANTIEYHVEDETGTRAWVPDAAIRGTPPLIAFKAKYVERFGELGEDDVAPAGTVGWTARRQGERVSPARNTAAAAHFPAVAATRQKSVDNAANTTAQRTNFAQPTPTAWPAAEAFCSTSAQHNSGQLKTPPLSAKRSTTLQQPARADANPPQRPKLPGGDAPMGKARPERAPDAATSKPCEPTTGGPSMYRRISLSKVNAVAGAKPHRVYQNSGREEPAAKPIESKSVAAAGLSSTLATQVRKAHYVIEDSDGDEVDQIEREVSASASEWKSAGLDLIGNAKEGKMTQSPAAQTNGAGSKTSKVERKIAVPEPPNVEDDGEEDKEYVVEKIVKHSGGKFGKYLVKWEGYGPEFNTWEPYENVCELKALDVYIAERAKARAHSKNGSF
ncbi:hypothetical protein HK101_001764 [Irineochytrium annulatum]|nr:hypothetical protein HK101_001764 [Irineochytrium annulatum]